MLSKGAQQNQHADLLLRRRVLRSKNTSESSWVMYVMATPLLPARPVRPVRMTHGEGRVVRLTNAVRVVLDAFGHVVVDDVAHIPDVETASCDVGGDQDILGSWGRVR